MCHSHCASYLPVRSEHTHQLAASADRERQWRHGVLLQHDQIGRHLEAVLEMLFGNSAVEGLPVVELAGLVERDYVIFGLVVDDAHDRRFMVLERVFDGGLVDIVHVDVVCDGIRYSEQGATPLGFCALYYVCISLLYTHVAGPGM